MHKISFSIVIPVYNSEKILPKLIDSVIFYLNKEKICLFQLQEYLEKLVIN